MENPSGMVACCILMIWILYGCEGCLATDEEISQRVIGAHMKRNVTNVKISDKRRISENTLDLSHPRREGRKATPETN